MGCRLSLGLLIVQSLRPEEKDVVFERRDQMMGQPADGPTNRSTDRLKRPRGESRFLLFVLRHGTATLLCSLFGYVRPNVKITQ